jgi:GNAT superfamily N-acetyltransferase
MNKILTRLIAPLEDSRFALQADGWQAAARTLVAQVGLLVYSSVEFIVLARSLENLEDAPEPHIPVEFRPGVPQDLGRLGHVVSPSRLRYFEHLFTCSGLYFFVAVHEGQLIACTWASTHVAPARERYDLKLEPWEAYGHNTNTAPAHRRQGIMSALLTYRNQWLRHQGCTRLITLVSADNAPSLGMTHKLGLEDIGRIKHRRILWWQKKETHITHVRSSTRPADSDSDRNER